MIRYFRKATAKPNLGTVDKNGTIRYSGDINDCRVFLRGLGLNCDTPRGWEGRDADGQHWIGILQYHEGQHHAAAWKVSK